VNWITNTLLALGVTRDSFIWFWSRLVAGATLVLTAGPLGYLDPYFSDDTQKWIVLGCAIVLWLAGKYDTSPLPGASSPPRNFAGRGTYMVLALALGGSLLLAGCASRELPDLPDVPAQVTAVDQDVRAGAAKALGILSAASRLADRISQIEDQAAREGAIPPAADLAFDRAMVGYANASDATVSRVMAGVTSWADLKAHLDPVIARVGDLAQLAQQIGVIRDRVGIWLDTLKDIVLELVTGGSSSAVASGPSRLTWDGASLVASGGAQ